MKNLTRLVSRIPASTHVTRRTAAMLLAVAIAGSYRPWSAARTIPRFRVVDFGVHSRAFDINDDGWAVGHADDVLGRRRAVLWNDEGVVDLGTLGGEEATAISINGSGVISGTSAVAGTSPPAATPQPGAILGAPGTRAFRWTHGRMTELGGLGGSGSWATAINSAGHVVGWSGIPGPPDDSYHGADRRAVVWKDEVALPLGTLGGTSSVAYDINDQGVVVGTSQKTDGSWRPFRWANSQFTILDPDVPGAAAAMAINEPGLIVGQSWPSTGGSSSPSGTRPGALRRRHPSLVPHGT